MNLNIKEMNFGKAIEALKQGKKVTRKGWNGKKMFLYYVPEGLYPARTDAAKSIADENGKVQYGPYIAMKTAQGNVVPWLASQTDMLSEDWEIVGECENLNKQPRFDSMEHNKMGDEVGSILSSIAKWAEGDKGKRSFILICSDTDLKKDEKGHNSQCVFAMQGKEELNEFSLFQIFNNDDAAVFKEMVKRALTLSIMKKLTSK